MKPEDPRPFGRQTASWTSPSPSDDVDAAMSQLSSNSSARRIAINNIAGKTPHSLTEPAEARSIYLQALPGPPAGEWCDLPWNAIQSPPAASPLYLKALINSPQPANPARLHIVPAPLKRRHARPSPELCISEMLEDVEFHQDIATTCSESDFDEFPSPDGFQSADRLHPAIPDCICRPFQARLKVRFEGWPTRPDRSDFYSGEMFAWQIRSDSSPIWHKTGRYWP